MPTPEIKDKPTGEVSTDVKEQVKQPDPAAATSFINSLLGKPKPSPPEKSDEQDDEKDDKKEPEKKAGPPKKGDKKPAKKAEPSRRAEIDPETLVSAAAEGAARALADREQPKEPAKVEETLETRFGSTEAKRIRVLEQMEKDAPDKYKGLGTKYQKSLQSLIEYANDWEKNHPGKQFNEDDDEHKQFLADNEVAWEDDDYAESLANMRADEIVGKKTREIDQKFEEINRDKRYNDAKPVIRGHQVRTARAFYADLGDDYKDLLGENGVVNQDTLKKLDTTNPVALRIAIQGADQVETYVHEVQALFNNYKHYDEKNPVHGTISNFVLAKEEQLLKKSKTDQKDNSGRPFMTAADYWKLEPKQREKYWTFTAGDIQTLLARAILVHTKQQITAKESEFEAMAKAKGIDLPTKKKEDKKPNPPAKKAESEEEQVETDNGKPRSPSAAFQSPRGDAPVKKGDDEVQNEPVQKFANRFLGR